VLHAPPLILDWIENGYRLPLKFIPPSWSQKTTSQFSCTKTLLQRQLRIIFVLLKFRYLCNPLSVVANAEGKLCLVLNLRYLNSFLNFISFKYKDLRTAALKFKKEEFMFKFDLKSGYHHVDVHSDFHKFLGFHWEIKGATSYFCCSPLRVVHSQLFVYKTFDTAD